MLVTPPSAACVCRQALPHDMQTPAASTSACMLRPRKASRPALLPNCYPVTSHILGRLSARMCTGAWQAPLGGVAVDLVAVDEEALGAAHHVPLVHAVRTVVLEHVPADRAAHSVSSHASSFLADRLGCRSVEICMLQPSLLLHAPYEMSTACIGSVLSQ